jgi:adenine phosphoribosyltransferase|tara:strand:- start:1889 stop:2383 length:495 start_codon:yes stop_codon:yes gene_type:complete
MLYKQFIKEIPNFPIDGVNFKDISPLLADQQTFLSVIIDMGRRVRLPDYWIGIDARGFIFASALAVQFGGGVVMCRKEGKLPPPTQTYGYNTEYSKDVLELKEGSGEVVIVDDVLATGGTIQIVNKLAENAGYDVVGNLVLIDLKYVPRVDDFDLNVKSVVEYE